MTESVAYVAASSEERTLVVDWIGFEISVIAYGWFLFLAVLRLQQCCVCVLDLVCILRRIWSFNINIVLHLDLFGHVEESFCNQCLFICFCFIVLTSSYRYPRGPLFPPFHFYHVMNRYCYMYLPYFLFSAGSLTMFYHSYFFIVTGFSVE